MKAALRVPTLALVAAVAVLASFTGPATAKGDYCKGVAGKAKKVATNGGVHLYKRGTDFILCSNKGRKQTSVPAGSDRGYKPKRFIAHNWKCAALLVTKRGAIPEIQTFNLKTMKRGRNDWASLSPIGYGSPGATVLTMTLTKNCVLVVGSIVANGDGTSRRQLDYINYNTNNSHLTFASGLNSNAELRAVKVKPKGKGATVTWKQDGEKHTYEIPGS